MSSMPSTQNLPSAIQNPMDSVLWPSTMRERHFQTWLNSHIATYQLRPESLCIASADASFRRYLRIFSESGKSFIIMDAPPDKEDSASFVKVARLFSQAGLNVPHIYAWDETNGFMLLNDLGAQTMLSGINLESFDENKVWYAQCIDILLKMQLASKPQQLPDYDAAVLERELKLFPDWYIQQHKGITLSNNEAQTLSQIFALIVQHNLAAPKVYVHRDFMPRNLMMPLPGSQDLGILDFQDALYGPITYDIASLMRDAFHSWDEEYTLDVSIRYWEKAKKAGLMDFADWHSDFAAFYRAVDWMALQRHLKVAGIFARLTLRDGKAKYLADAPRFIHYIRATASRYRELTPLLRLVDKVENIESQNAYSFGRIG